ncbi:uncharacterized protein LOC129000166 [Macrosteles quadrilineatus]|uniref:uncharacterized protein LOC129000166 n=1 Tax=Macrosteles quadrilineatus TaxID=74068 RepID=UPI0023E0E547|nr:uncharacterized protein LOC129000166 [Macrosteles quadrilineatus]
MTSSHICISLALVLRLALAYQGGRLPPELRATQTTSPCRLDGEKEVPHGHQIERDDPCEFCICIDSKVFCWWGQQHCTNNESSDNSTDSTSPSWSDSSDNSSSLNTTDSTEPSTTPTLCTVMGRQYSVGAVLPRDTGTCLECVCGKAGRVTCSPKDCIRPSDDFHNSDPSNSLDMFDVDVF